MKHLYFTRHAEQHRRTSGQRSTEYEALTDVGKWHAAAAAIDARTRGLDFDIIMCSPLPHAVHTAHIIADELDYNTKHIVLSDLLLGYGWGRPTHHAPGHVIAPSHEQHFQPASAEAKHTLEARALKILEHLLERPEHSVLLVGHSAFGHALQRLLGKQPPVEDFQANELPHAQIVQFM